MENFQIRNVLEKDFTKIAKLAENCNIMETERNTIYHIFTKFFKNTSFVAEIPGKREVTGFILGFISQKNPKEAYIHQLCVKSQLRRKGIAKKLLEKFLKGVRDFGCSKVFLIIKPENRVSIKFHKKLGFELYENQKLIEINGQIVVKDYDGPGKHMVVFYKYLDNKS
ncbi:MAG: GNAT family N-acetyltransferase [Euryarchaeota archaeon]|nr:GNAT family N-acetyltransferase [Euryarchaeota archaeon]